MNAIRCSLALARRTSIAAAAALAAASGAAAYPLEAGARSVATRNSGVRVTTVNADAPYPEGPLWLDGRLYYTEYAPGRVMSWDGTTNRRVWTAKDCGPSGLVEAPHGTLLVTCYDNNTLAQIDRRGATVRIIRHDSAGRPFHGPNDFTRDSRGGIYFSDSGTYTARAPTTGTVDYIAPNGSIRVVARHIHYSNGLAITPDRRHVLVSEMLANRVLRYTIGRGGRLSHRQVLVRLGRVAPVANRGPLDGPDGLKVDRRGRIYIAQNGAGRVIVVSPSGRRLLRTVTVGARNVTNVAFGATQSTLYITAAINPDHPPYLGKVFQARLS